MADEFYGTVADSKLYHGARGNLAWATDDDVTLEQILLRASEAMDGIYRSEFPGYKTGRRDQVREWPRQEAYDTSDNYISSTTIPQEMIWATYEAALREQAVPGTLTPDVNLTKRYQSVSVVGAVAVTYASIPARAESYRLIMTIVDAIIAPILTGGDGTSQITGRSYFVG